MSGKTDKFNLFDWLNMHSEIIERIEEEYTKEFNIFKVLKVSHFEVKHSNFLAWLFKFQEWDDWGIENSFLKRFIEKCHIDFELSDVDYFDVKTELCIDDSSVNMESLKDHGRIDIAIIGHKKVDGEDNIVFTCIIENKYGSMIHDEQLPRYKKYMERTYQNGCFNSFVFLDTLPTMYDPDDNEYEGYRFISYSDIEEILKKIRDEKDKELRDIRWDFIEQYIALMEENDNQLDANITKICDEIDMGDIIEIRKSKKNIKSYQYRNLKDCDQLFLDIIDRYYDETKQRMDDYIKGNLLSILLDKKQDLGKYEYACSVQVPKFTGSEYVINTVDYTAVPGISVGIYAGLNITLSKRLISYIVNHPSDFIDNLCDLPGWDISLKLIVKKGDIHSLAEFEYDIEKLKNKIKSVSDADDIKLLFPETIMCRRYINPKMAKEYATRNNTEKKKAGKKTKDLNNRKFLPLVIKNKNMILDYIEACDLITESNKEYNLKQIKEYCNDTTNMDRYITSLYCLSMKRSYQDKYDNNDAIQSFFYDSTEKGLSVFGEVEKKHFMDKFICNKQ